MTTTPQEGLVPLSSLSREPRSLLLSSSPRLLAGRNLTLGKPGVTQWHVQLGVPTNDSAGHYVRQDGRLVAVGGTRNKTNSAVKIVKVPSFGKETNKMPLFVIDDEMASFACSTIRPPASGRRVDIRQVKVIRAREQAALEARISGKESFLDKMIIKLKWNEQQEEGLGSETPYVEHMTSFQEAKIGKAKEKSKKKEEEASRDEFRSFNIGPMDYYQQDELESSTEDVKKEEAETSKDENGPADEIEVGACESTKEEEEEAAVLVVKNSWSSVPRNVVPDDLNMDECPPLRGYSVSSIKPIQRTPNLNFDGYTGWDSCDLPACVCRDSSGRGARAGAAGRGDTPLTCSHSGSQTPSQGARKGSGRIAKDLLRVKRALKTLGVKIIEFDDHDGGDDTCTKDYCKFGCICDSLRTKQMPPSHCGKVDCMFSCCCSKEALKYSSCGSRRVNISAAVGARIQEDSQRNMAVEERKFSNTVVVTSDKDAVMLGDRTGRGSRRERKLPQRYQNSNTLMLDVAGKEYVEKEVSSGSDSEYEEEKVVDPFRELKRAKDILPCSVVMPKVGLHTAHCTLNTEH